MQVIRRMIMQEDTGTFCAYGPVFARDSRTANSLLPGTFVYVAHYFSTREAARKLHNGYGRVVECHVET